jgi:hypothetical protein
VSDIDPQEITVVARRAAPEQFSQGPADLPPAATGFKKPDREGLPPGYRMRADSHYVEQLTSRRTEHAPADHPRPASKEADGLPSNGAIESRDRRDSRDRRTERLLAQLADAVASIEATTVLLAGDSSPMVRRVSADLIAAQAGRASWLLRAAAVLDGAHPGRVRPYPLGSILSDVRDKLAAECRLTGTDLHIQTADWTASVAVDEPRLVAGLTGAVIATFGLIGNAQGVAISLTAVASAGELRTVEVTQDDISVAPGIGSRFFDASWADRPDGWVAGLGAATARAVAQQHGGGAVFQAGDRSGSTIRLTFSSE